MRDDLDLDLDTIEGAGGGKGGGSTRGATEAPNTLQSRATVRVIDLISEGEIEGLVDGGKSAFFDDTALQAADASYNFDGVTLHERVGTAAQAHIPNWPGVESVTSVGVEATNSSPVTRTISDTTVDSVRTILRIPALTEQDTSTGDLKGHTVTIEWWVTPNGGSATKMITDVIRGKCVQPYERGYLIPLDGSGPWDVELRRISADETLTSKQSSTFWASYTTIIEAKLNYPDLALIGVEVDAELFGNSVPRRGYEVKGLKVKIPSNYNPLTRVYTGSWDGTFTTAWTDNPAWVAYDLLSNDRYGLGDLYTASDLDKWDFYAAAQHCDELVNDGAGGTHPRFTFNGVLNTREAAIRVLEAVLGSMRASLLWNGGQVGLIQNKAQSAVKTFSPANVVDGMFHYTGTALTARHTVAHVTWNDPDKQYQQDILIVEDQAGIERYGYNVLETVAYGCTRKAQAYRHGLFALLTERLETDTVSFKIGYAEADVLPGDVVMIADPQFTTQDYGGRVAAIASTVSLTLDRTLDWDSGETYTLNIVKTDGTVTSHAIVNPGTTTSAAVNLTGDALDNVDNYAAGTMWSITTGSVAPRKFRVMSISESADGTFEVFALQYESSKFAAAESAYNLDAVTSAFSDLPDPGIVQPPESLDLAFYTKFIAQGSRQAYVSASWTAPATFDPYFKTYRLVYQVDGGNWSDPLYTRDLSIDLPVQPVGTIRVELRAVNQTGRQSQPVRAAMTLDDASVSGDALISNLVVRGGGTSWDGLDLYMDWDAVAPNGAGSLDVAGIDPHFKRFRVRLKNASDTVLATFHTLKTEYAIPFEELTATETARTYKIGVSVEDIFGNFSTEAVTTITNAAPSLPSITTVNTPLFFGIDFTEPDEADYRGILVWMSETSGFTPGSSNLVWRGQGNPRIGVNQGTTYYFRYALFDAWGGPDDGSGLNVATEGTFTTGTIVDDAAQAAADAAQAAADELALDLDVIAAAREGNAILDPEFTVSGANRLTLVPVTTGVEIDAGLDPRGLVLTVDAVGAGVAATADWIETIAALAGARVEAGVDVEAVSGVAASVTARLVWLDAAGAVLSTTSLGSGASGRLAGLATAPASTRAARLRVEVTASGAGAGAATLRRPFLAAATDDQASPSAYAPPADGALSLIGETRRLLAHTAADLRAVESRSSDGLARVYQLERTQIADGVAIAAHYAAVTARLGDAEADVSVLQTAVATLEGYAEARFSIVATAGSATAYLGLVATDSGGTPYTQAVIEVDEFIVGASGETAAAPLEFRAGVLRVKAAQIDRISAGSAITLGSENWPVSLQDKQFVVSDGTVISYGLTFATPPDVVFDTNGLAPLGAGEIYLLTASGLTGTGFTASLKIITPGTTTAYSDTTDAAGGGGDPDRVMHKSVSNDATNGKYTFTTQVTGQPSEYINDEIKPGYAWRIYVGAFDAYIDDGGGWTLAATFSGFKAIYGAYGSHPATTPITITGTVDWTGAIGQHGGAEFGADGAPAWPGVPTSPVTDLVSVSWSYTTTSGTRTATPGGESTSATVKPRNVA